MDDADFEWTGEETPRLVISGHAAAAGFVNPEYLVWVLKALRDHDHSVEVRRQDPSSKLPFLTAPQKEFLQAAVAQHPDGRLKEVALYNDAAFREYLADWDAADKKYGNHHPKISV